MLGLALGQQGDRAGAETEYREAVRLDPKFAVAHANLGLLLCLKGNFAEGFGEIRLAYQLDPNNAQVIAIYNQIVGKMGH